MLLTQKRSLFVNTNLTTLVLLVDNGSLKVGLVVGFLLYIHHTCMLFLLLHSLFETLNISVVSDMCMHTRYFPSCH